MIKDKIPQIAPPVTPTISVPEQKQENPFVEMYNAVKKSTSNHSG